MFNIFTLLFKKSNKTNKKKSFLFYILADLLILIISGFFFFLYYQSNKSKCFSLTKLTLQTSVHPSSCISSFFFLGKIQALSPDKNNVYSDTVFLQNQLKKQLLENNIFHSLRIKISKHNQTITIKYQLRTPVAYLGNLSNTFIDDQGTTFPATPFFLPQKLPTIFSKSFSPTEKRIDEKEILLMKKILHYELPITVIDFSKLSYPASEIVITLCNQDIIRVSTNNFEETLKYYQFLKNSFYKNSEKERIIFDFRIKGLAFTQIIK